MIGRISGILLLKKPPYCVIDINGLGYEVEVSMTTFARLPDENKKVTLHTHHHVREDVQQLFGFFDESERVLFRALIKVNGVGPRSAITLLSSTTPKEFHRCIQEDDKVSLTRLPGIGKKTAERLLIEMRDRIGHDAFISSHDESLLKDVIKPRPRQDAVEALIALGYKPQHAQKAIQKIQDESLSSEEMIRLALQGAEA